MFVRSTAGRLALMDVYSGRLRLAVALHHAEKRPAVALIKGSVVGQKIERIDAAHFHVGADEMQKRARDTAASVMRLRVYGADVERKVVPIVKIVFDHAHTCDDPCILVRQIPLRDGMRAGKASFHACKVGALGNAPIFHETTARPPLSLRRVRRSYDLVVHGILRYFAVFLFSPETTI